MSNQSPPDPQPDPQTEPQSIEIPLNPKTKAYALLFVILLVIGGISTGRTVSGWIIGRLTDAGIIENPEAIRAMIPISANPGPPRAESVEFKLTDEDSKPMVPHNDPKLERWADLAGNYYTQDFIAGFSYEQPEGAKADTAPYVRVHVDASGPTLKGRLEAHGLKPNFAYQIKLRGSYERDRDSFAIIGALGRWRLPGHETNFSDEDFKLFPHKNLVEAYILFDYFVTDAKGNAVRDFALDASLHVLWDAPRQRPNTEVLESDILPIQVDASSGEIYARPKAEPTTHYLWAERERIRYDAPNQIIHLPPTTYKAELVLTEESFHSTEADGGWWATVYALPIEFEIAQ